jgi:dTDP-4-amino-4,6-dideoxygalactose transaminase
MDRADWVLAERARVAASYDEALARIDWLVSPAVPAGFQHGYQSYVCLFAPGSVNLETIDGVQARRNQLMAALEARGIATRPGTHAPVLLDYYRTRYGLVRDQFAQATIADHASVSLPIFPGMLPEDIDYVVDVLLTVMRETR